MYVNLGGALIVFSILAFVAFLVWNRSRANSERRRLEFEAQARLLEKIGPGTALTEFLGTDTGKRLFGSLSTVPTKPAAGADLRWPFLILTTLGIVALFAGFFFMMAVLIPTHIVGGVAPFGGARLLAALPVLLLTGAGVGALVAAWFMHRMSKKWGMPHAGTADDGTA